MDNSSPSGNTTEPPNSRWASILGTAIAVLTLTLPMVVIAYYSSPDSLETFPQARYSLLRDDKIKS
jgi:hypothetical protein